MHDPEEIRTQFLEAYDTLNDAIFRHCAFRVWDRDRAWDLTQETFVRTWEYLTKGNTVENLKAFLYRVANNLIIDEARKKRPNISLETLAEQGFDPMGEGEHEVMQSTRARELQALLGDMDEGERQILIMRYIDDLSPKEIATVLEKTENAISVRIHRAIKKLKESGASI